jgi:hypothetical protein
VGTRPVELNASRETKSGTASMDRHGRRFIEFDCRSAERTSALLTFQCDSRWRQSANLISNSGHRELRIDQRRSTSTLTRIAFAFALAALSALSYFTPYYDWDLAAYVGCAIATHESNPATIYGDTIADLRRELPQDAYDEITAASDFRLDLSKNPQHFVQQLRFYRIRPLYIRALVALHALGLGYIAAAQLISIAAFAGIGLLLFIWTSGKVGGAAAAICVSLLLFTPVLFTSARTGSPDALSAFVVLLGTYLLVKRKAITSAAVLLLISLFIRTDNILYVTLLCCWQAWRSTGKRTRLYWISAALLAVICVFSVNRVEHSYGWRMLMQNTETPIVNPAEIAPDFSVRDYFAAWIDTVDEARENSVLVFPFLAVLVLLTGRAEATMSGLVKIVLLSWLARLLLFPHIEDRYFISGSALIGIAAISTLVTMKDRSKPANMLP